MKERFSVYDFAGYIVPGMMAVWTAYVIFNAFTIPFPLKLKADIPNSSLFLVVSYFVGHLVQRFGNILEDRLKKKWGGFHSVKSMEESDNTYTQEFKNKIKGAASDFFDLPENVDSLGRFNLMYTLLVQKNLAKHTEVFNSIYGLYRGLVITSIMGEAAFAVKAVRSFILKDYRAGIMGVLVIVALEVARRAFLTRMERFSKRFADSVYRGFYAYYRALKSEG